MSAEGGTASAMPAGAGAEAAPPEPGAAAAQGGGPSGGGPPPNMQHMAAQRRMQQTQAQVDEVVEIMKQNVNVVLERDAKLGELELRSDRLEEGASMFEKQAKSLKNKFWLENMKMIAVMGLIGIIFIGILWYKYGGSPEAPTPTVVATTAAPIVSNPTDKTELTTPSVLPAA